MKLSSEKISVVIPAYRSSQSLQPLYERLVKTLTSLTTSFEIIFIEDHGQDVSWDIIKKFAQNDRRVFARKMSRNFGQHAAITAGLAQASGDWVVVMDCDLQDPPEEITQLYEKAKEGFDTVLAVRQQKKHSWFRKCCSVLYFKLLCAFNQNEYGNKQCGSFSIISRRVVEAFLTVKDKHRHYLFILHWLGFKTGFITYVHQERFAGNSAYTLFSLISHGVDGIFFQTTTFLKAIIGLGLMISGLAGLFAMYIIFCYFKHSALTGWTTLSVLILLMSGFIIVSTGIVGLYVAKIFEQVKGRPLYIIEESIND